MPRHTAGWRSSRVLKSSFEFTTPGRRRSPRVSIPYHGARLVATDLDSPQPAPNRLGGPCIRDRFVVVLNGGKPERDLALGRIGRVRPVHQIEPRLQAEIAPDRAGYGIVHRVRAP